MTYKAKIKYQSGCNDYIVNSRNVGLKYYLMCIMDDLYRCYDINKYKLTLQDINQLDYMYQYFMLYEGKWDYDLMDPKMIYSINFLLSNYSGCFTERVQHDIIKKYLKTLLSKYPKYKKNLSVLHSNVKYVNKIYNATKKGIRPLKFEKQQIQPLFYKKKQEIRLSNILCVFECMKNNFDNINMDELNNIIKNNYDVSIKVFELSKLANNYKNNEIIQDNNNTNILETMLVEEEEKDNVINTLMVESGEESDFGEEYYEFINNGDISNKDKNKDEELEPVEEEKNKYTVVTNEYSDEDFEYN